MLSKLSRKPILSLAALALIVAACGESTTPPPTSPVAPNGPNLGVTDPFNSLGNCLAADVVAAPAGFTGPSLVSGHCTSQDIKIATADILEYSFNGTDFFPFDPANPISCEETKPIFLRINAHVKETATSERTDVGVWVSQDGGNARTGSCNHYNLAPTPVLNGAPIDGVSNIDGDQCGDMNNAGESILELGIINAVCQTSGVGGSNLLHVGSCLGWTQPGGDQVCPLEQGQNPPAPGTPNGFRFATIPGTSSKCNCEGFDVPIVVLKSAKLEIVKACTPSTDGGKFNLKIDANVEAADAACGGTTGSKTVGAGSSASPGAAHTFGEAAGTGTSLADYASSFACVNRSNSSTHAATGTATSGSITLQPNEDVICTITNVRNTGTVELKKVWSGTAGQTTLKIGTSANGSEVKSQLTGAAGAAPLTTGAQNVNTGTYYVSETGGLTDYTSSLACTDNGAPVTPGANNSVSVTTGHAVVCTFTNTRNQGTIKLDKVWVGTGSQTTLNIGTSAGGTQVASQQTGAAGAAPLTTGAQTVNTGTYYVAEVGGLGGYGTSLACVDGSGPVTVGASNSVSVAKDQNVVCTFTNSRDTGTIKLDKVWVGTGGQTTLRIGTSANGTQVASQLTGAAGAAPLTTGAQNVNTGTYYVSETGGLTDYTSSLACSDGDNPVPVGVDNAVAVAKDQNVVCTFTNTRNQGTIELKKVWVAGGGQTTLNIGTSAGGTQVATQLTGAAGAAPLTTGAQSVNTGTYFVAETGGLTDFLTALACTDNGQAVTPGANNSVSVTTGHAIVCTFTNTRRPQVKLVKDLVPDADLGRFDLTIAGTTFNNGGGGYGDQGNTGFQNVSVGSVTISESAHAGTTLSEYASSLSCDNGKTVSANTGISGSITVAAGEQITCTFVNNHQPRLTITKTPDAGGAGYNVSPGGTATFTVTVSNASNGGPALNVQLIDTLPAGVGDWTENPDKTECTIVAFPTATDPKRLLTCSGGALAQLNGGASFTVVVQATVPNSFLLQPPAGTGTPIEIDGNLIDDGAAGKDWASVGINCTSTPKVGCAIDLPTGQTDDSFGNGTKEDDAVPSVIDGSIPNNKSDLTRFYVGTERFVTTDFLYLAWERVQEPSGTTNMDFELNQSSTLSSNGKTPVRTAGDILIKYDLSQGGVNPVLGFHRWVTTGACQANGAKAPCWGPVQPITVDVAAAINTGSVSDPINPDAPRTLSPRTFGEARINLQAAGIFVEGQCVNFGQAYLKSRSSDSFTAAVKDFIAPIGITVSNCAPKNLDNRAWARASNFAPAGGSLNAWFSDTGQIHVGDAAGVFSPLRNSPLNRQLAWVGATAAVARAGLTYGAPQRVGSPWPPSTAFEKPAGRGQVPALVPRPTLRA